MKYSFTLFSPLGFVAALNFPSFSLTCTSGQPGAVYYCSGAKFGGDCVYRFPNDDCYAPSTAPISIGPDEGGYCVLFEDRECKGTIIHYDEDIK